jgi:hypothetical protein
LHVINTPHGENVYVVVIENVFNTTKKIHEKYDLKGSWVHRKVGKAHEADRSVLGMDLDLHKKLNISENLKKRLIAQVEADAKVFDWSNFSEKLIIDITVFCKSQHYGLLSIVRIPFY